MKSIYIIILSLFAALQVRAQQQASFKFTFLPQKKYTITKEQKINLVMDTGKTTGQSGPMTMDMAMKTITDITTGAQENTQLIPMQMISRSENVKIIVNGQDLPGSGNVSPPSITLFGKFQSGEKLSIDSVSGIEIPDSMKNRMAMLVDAVTNNLAFPSHPLKVGDSFTNDVPLILPAIPMGPTGGATMKIMYTLMSITGNMGTFDYTETINPDPKHDTSTKGKPINMSGRGKGTVSFDISKQFFSAMTDILTLRYDMISGMSTLKFSGTFVSVDKAVSNPEMH